MTEKTFVNKLSERFAKEGFFTRKEVGVGYGVADLVVIKKSSINSSHCNLRKSYGQTSKLLREDYFQVLDLIPDGPEKTVDFDYLMEKTNLSRALLRYTILQSLERKKFIKSRDGKCYFKINGWAPLAKEVVAIEAKLHDWRRGFLQANRYKSFADKVYLAVPKKIEHLVNQKLLAKYNIGLISFDPMSGKKKVLVTPKKTPALNKYKRNFAIEFFWGNRTLRELSLS